MVPRGNDIQGIVSATDEIELEWEDADALPNMIGVYRHVPREKIFYEEGVDWDASKAPLSIRVKEGQSDALNKKLFEEKKKAFKPQVNWGNAEAIPEIMIPRAKKKPETKKRKRNKVLEEVESDEDHAEQILDLIAEVPDMNGVTLAERDTEEVAGGRGVFESLIDNAGHEYNETGKRVKVEKEWNAKSFYGKSDEGPVVTGDLWGAGSSLLALKHQKLIWS